MILESVRTTSVLPRIHDWYFFRVSLIAYTSLVADESCTIVASPYFEALCQITLLFCLRVQAFPFSPASVIIVICSLNMKERACGSFNPF